MPRPPTARMFIPSPGLTNCVLTGVIRDTRGSVLSDRQRFNYFPSTPMSSVSWFFEGTSQFVGENGLGPTLPRLIISGPRPRPTASWNAGEVYVLTVAFYPETLTQLTGVAPQELSGRDRALEDVVSGRFLEACRAILDKPGDDPFLLVEDMLELLWTGSRPAEGRSVVLMTDWVRSQMTRAAYSKPGRGVRQLQRLIRTWTGQSQRDLQIFARAEQAFLLRAENRHEGPLDLATIAAGAGYADQSHMGRDIRRMSGFSPKRLDELMVSEEPFWLYRLFSDQFGG